METTLQLKWVKPTRILGKTMASFLDPMDMLKDFLKHGLIPEITSDYHLDVTDMCRNGATWLGAHMAHYIASEVEVVEGTFEGFSHCWCVLGEYYYDMTIAQANPEYPHFAIIKQKDAVGYEEFMRFPVEKWLKMNM